MSLIAVILAVGGGRAAETPQAGRFLLIFETSPVLKKNLPMVRATLAELFASNFQNEIATDDELAVWTVDQDLHTGTYPLVNWSPDDASMSAERLSDFLGHQKYTRHATLDPVQPLLNRVVRTSDRLTVLIFCDGQSRLQGTPYDAGVNNIMTNAVARLKGGPMPFFLVLRAYHGEYLGCSVNRAAPLNFPKFPSPPKPEPPAVAQPAPAPVLQAPVTGPVVAPVPAIIIVGTNASTNAAAVLAPAAAAPMPAPPSKPNPAMTNAGAPAKSGPAPAPQIGATPRTNSQQVPALVPAPETSGAQTSAPELAAVSNPPAEAPASSETVSPSNTVAAAAEKPPMDTGYLVPLAIGGGALVIALGLVIWVATRTRRPHSSLITSSMQDDPRLPPRK